MGVGAVVKAAVGKRAAEPFVKEQEEQGDVNPFWGEELFAEVGDGMKG